MLHSQFWRQTQTLYVPSGAVGIWAEKSAKWNERKSLIWSLRSTSVSLWSSHLSLSVLLLDVQNFSNRYMRTESSVWLIKRNMIYWAK